MSTGTHRSACHVCFVAKPELSDPGRESVAKPTREQGLSFTATTGVTSGSSQETSGGMAQSPAPAPRTPTVPAPGGVVWGGRSVLCRLRCGVSARESCLERRAGYHHHHRHPPGGLLSSAPPAHPLGSGLQPQLWLISTAPCLLRPRMDAPLCPRGPTRPQGERHSHPELPPGPRELAAPCLSLCSPIIVPHHGDKTTLEIPEAPFTRPREE